MDTTLFLLALLIYFTIGSPMQLVIFIALLVLISWVIWRLTRRYLEAEAPAEFRNLPLPFWMWVIILIAAFFPAFILATLVPD